MPHASQAPTPLALRNALLAKRAELLTRRAYEHGGIVGRAQVAAEPYDTAAGDNAQLRTERETQFALNEHGIAELANIERALEQMNQGHYGHCIDCEVTIAPARLMATPTALRCISCQALHESQHPHF